MRKSVIKTASLALVMSLLALGAGAQQQGGVNVGSNVKIKAKVGDVVSQVRGRGARGTVEVGAVSGSTNVGGNVDIRAKAGDIVSQVEGSGACGAVRIGVVGGNGC